MNNNINQLQYCIKIWSFLALVFFILISFPKTANAQGGNVKYGKNRVQYKDFDWFYHESNNFKVYYYSGGQEIGKFTNITAEKVLIEVSERLEYQLQNKIDVVVYNDFSDLKQTNIGQEVEQFESSGTTKILGNKIFIYFDGNHQKLNQNIKEGVANLLINDMLWGGNLQDVIQNAVLLNLPPWFLNGLVSYLGDNWNSTLDGQLKNEIINQELKSFNELSIVNPTLAGHSFWHYVASNYGKSAIPNLLYITRVNRNLESGYNFVMGSSDKEVYEEWYYFYYQLYVLDKAKRNAFTEPIKAKTKKHRNYHKIALSPKADKVAFVEYNKGIVRVKVNELGQEKSSTIFKTGARLPTQPYNIQYPVIAWGPKDVLAIFYIKRDKLKLAQYSFIDNKITETRDIGNFQQIVHANFMSNGKQLLISAVRKGQSDIYLYGLANGSLKQITNDFYDDLYPAEIKFAHYNGIVFSSNRIDDTLRQKQKLDTILPIGQFDLFYYDLDKKGEILGQLTNTPLINESQSFMVDSAHFCFLSDANGIYNRHAGAFDSTFSHNNLLVYLADTLLINPKKLDSIQSIQPPIIDSIVKQPVYKLTANTFAITNYQNNINYQVVNQKMGKVAHLSNDQRRSKIYIEKLSVDKPIKLRNTTYKKQQLLQNQQTVTDVKPLSAEEEGMQFQTKFPIETDANNSSSKASTKNFTDEEDDKGRAVFKRGRAMPYNVEFSADFLSTQIDNNLIYNQYQIYDRNNAPKFEYPDLSAMIKISATDKLEDYRLLGGFKVPTSLSGSEYFLSYDNFKKRLDKQVLFYRSVELNPVQTQNQVSGSFETFTSKVGTNYMQGSLKYPLSVFARVQGSLGYRYDNIAIQATDFATLQQGNIDEHWASTKFEFVFDNSFKVMTNIRNGTRAKVWYELHRQIDDQKGFLHIVALDARHYQKLHKQITLATRFAGATSFGQQKMLYYLGGVDGWLHLDDSKRFDSRTQVAEDENFGYQTIATNLRGFKQNIRNGSSYAAINTELRVPVFSYISRKQLKSKFLRDFQIIGFADVGAAWLGLSPYSSEAPYANITYPNPAIGTNPVKVDVQYYRNPFVGGYGAGVRTSFLGYFFRFDSAWGLDTGLKVGPQYYFSMAKDF